MKINLDPAIIELAAKYDRLANEANFDESKHPRSDDGKFTSGGGGGGSSGNGGEKQGGKPKEGPAETKEGIESMAANIRSYLRESRSAGADYVNRYLAADRKGLHERFTPPDHSKQGPTVSRFFQALDAEAGAALTRQKDWIRSEIRAMHKAAIQSGLQFNPKTHQYE